jgi:hypothetical protein
MPVDEMLRRMSSREFSEWMTYYAWRAHVAALYADAAKHDAPLTEEVAMEQAWRAMGVAVDDD